MATSDERELKLKVTAEDRASKPLKQVGDAADDTKDDLEELNAGLKKLDEQTAEATEAIAKLRAEVAKTGDLELLKDVQKQEQRLRAFARQRRLLLGDDDKPKKAELPKLPDVDVDRAGIGIAARLGPVIVKNLPAALSAGGGVGAAIGAPLVAGLVTWFGTASVGAAMGGAAVGAVAAGVKIAARDQRVQDAGSSLAESIGAQLEDAAAPFVPATLRSIDKVKTGFHDLDDEIGDIFADSAQYVEPLTDAVIGLVRGGVNGFRDFVRGAEPVVDMLRTQLPELGEEIGDALSTLSKHGPEAARALGLVIEVVGAGIQGAAKMLSATAEVFKWVDIITGSALRPDTAAQYQVAAKAAEESADGWAGALGELSGKADTATAEVRSLSEAVSDIVDKNLSLAEANLALADAVDAATESVDGKRKVSRAEERALIDLAEASNAATESMDESGVTAEQASRQHEANRQTLINAAVAMGYTRERAEELANEWLKVPRNVGTTASADTKKAEDAAKRLQDKIAQIDRYISITAKFDLINDDEVAMALRLGRLSSGGRVDGPGQKGVDSKPYLLAPGEYVLSARDVDTLGGADRIDAWRQDLHASTGPAMAAAAASGGGGGGGGVTSIQVSAAPGGGQELVRLLMPLLRFEVVNSYGSRVDRAFVTG